MAYVSAKLRLWKGGVINQWVYDTADTLATVLGASYVTDAVTIAKGALGKGMRPGDEVLMRRFTTVADDTTFLGAFRLMVSSVSTSTGAGTLILSEASAGPVSCTIALAAGASNVCTVTVTFKDALGNTLADVFNFDLYTSSVATGIGVSTVSYSGSLVAVTGALIAEHTAKHVFSLTTAATGIFVGSLTDSAKTQGEYIVVRLPNGKVFLSAATVTASYGA